MEMNLVMRVRRAKTSMHWQMKSCYSKLSGPICKEY